MRLSLTTKIFLAFAFLLATFALLTFYSVQEFHQVGEELRGTYEGQLALARLVGQLETHEQNRFRDLRRGVQESDERSRRVIFRVASAYFPDVIQARVNELRNISESQLARIDRSDESSGAKMDFYREVLSSIDRIREQNDAVDELTEALALSVQEPRPEDRPVRSPEDLAAELDRIEDRLNGELYELNRRINDEANRTIERADRDERRAIWRVLALTAIALIVGIFVTVLAARTLAAPLRRLVGFARALSRGDYTQTVDPGSDDALTALAEELAVMGRARKEREDELAMQRAELERAYHRVDELKRYHESVVQSLRTAVLVTDRALQVTSTNRAAEEHFGLKADKRSLDGLPLGQKLIEQLGPLDELAEKAQTVSVPALALGSLLVDVSIFPFKNERDRVMGLVVALEDVTEAVQTKEALIRSERLAAIGRMSAHVTHEVRNPLSSIGLNAELLLDMVEKLEGVEAEEAQKICTAIGREVDRLTAITEAYLKFARLPRPVRRPEDLNRLLQTVAAFVRQDCEAAQVDLSLTLPAQEVVLAVDADQIRQAILNLLRNGKEAMPRGGRLDLVLEADEEQARIRVRDQGGGIDPADVDRIFDPFFSTKLTGTGLGLALCQQIVGEHGGSLTVHSEPGEGSEFTIALDRSQATEVPALSETARPALAADAG